MIKRTVLLASLCLVMFSCEKKEGGAAKGSKKTAKAVPGAYTEKPNEKYIPEGPITGNANNEKFTCEQVVFQPSLGKWTMRILSEKLPKPLGFNNNQSAFVNITLPEVPVAGKVYQKDLKYGDGYFQVKKSDEDKTTSWNASNSYYIEITKWDVKEYNSKKGMFQVGGKASGKVYVAYKGSGNFKQSVVAGTFEDAVVRYMGKPKLKY